MSIMEFTDEKYTTMIPRDFRQIVRQGEYTGSTMNACSAYARTGLVIIPKEFAFDFFLFSQRNPKPFPIIDVTDPGSPHPMRVAPEADLRTDVPSYNIYVNGKLEKEVTDITAYWRDDLVAFLTGCSKGFDAVFKANDINYRFIGTYTSSIPCVPAGCFKGPMVVTCRLVKGGRDAVRTIQITSRYPAYHGSPIHIGDPAVIGIKDLCHPDLVAFSETIAPQEPDEVAIFWGCAYGLNAVAMESKLPLMITVSGASLFVTDRIVEDLAVIS